MDFAPSLMARIVLERFLQEKEQAIRKYLSWFFFFCVFLILRYFWFNFFSDYDTKIIKATLQAS